MAEYRKHSAAVFTPNSMEPIAKDILANYDDILKQRNVPLSAHNDYRKWLRYFLDFCAKYRPPASKSEQVKLFIEKLRSKKQPVKQQEQAAHAVSIFFALQRGNKAISSPFTEYAESVCGLESQVPKLPERQTAGDAVFGGGEGVPYVSCGGLQGVLKSSRPGFQLLAFFVPVRS